MQQHEKSGLTESFNLPNNLRGLDTTSLALPLFGFWIVSFLSWVGDAGKFTCLALMKNAIAHLYRHMGPGRQGGVKSR